MIVDGLILLAAAAAPPPSTRCGQGSDAATVHPAACGPAGAVADPESMPSAGHLAQPAIFTREGRTKAIVGSSSTAPIT